MIRARQGDSSALGSVVKEFQEKPDDLLIALARAHLWEELIESGRFGSIRELAETIGMDSAYAARIMGLTLLAPEIVRAIVLGEEPEGLSYRVLARPFPVMWEEQSTMLGIDGDAHRYGPSDRQ